MNFFFFLMPVSYYISIAKKKKIFVFIEGFLIYVVMLKHLCGGKFKLN
jgi:hypothetical protein